MELAEVPASANRTARRAPPDSRTSSQERGVTLNGLILVSSWLNAYVDFGGPPNSLDITYELYLPTMAASAWYHKKLPQQPPALAPFLDEVRAFALGPYQRRSPRGTS